MKKILLLAVLGILFAVGVQSVYGDELEKMHKQLYSDPTFQVSVWRYGTYSVYGDGGKLEEGTLYSIVIGKLVDYAYYIDFMKSFGFEGLLYVKGEDGFYNEILIRRKKVFGEPFEDRVLKRDTIRELPESLRFFDEWAEDMAICMNIETMEPDPVIVVYITRGLTYESIMEIVYEWKVYVLSQGAQ